MHDLWGTDWNSRGELDGRRYHDGQLLGVVVSGRDEVTLMLQGPGGEPCRLVLHEVSDLSVDDFRLGNIISDVWFLPKPLWEPSLGTDVRMKFGANATGPLVAVICSYGALVLALCGRVDVH